MKRKTRLALILMTLLMLALLAGCATDNTGMNAPSLAGENSTVTENEAPNSSREPENDIEGIQETTEEIPSDLMNLHIGEYLFTATLVNNSTTEAIKSMLAEGPITIEMSDYGNMEKVGSFETSLPRNDEQITTEPGDLILYQGKAFVIYYAPNSWSFTRIGKINNVTQEELKQALGTGEVTVTLSLARD